MGTYLYCLLPRGVAIVPDDLTGIGGAAVRAITAGNLVAWVSTTDRVPEPGVELAKVHNDVVEAALAGDVTPLPARFGQVFADDAMCVADLGKRAASLTSALARVANMVEMGILIAPATVDAHRAESDVAGIDASVPGAGRRYLAALREQERERKHWADAVGRHIGSIEAELGALVRGTARVEPRRGVAAGVAHLVPRESVSRYREIVRGHTAPTDFRLVIAGPRAPYSFADDGTTGTDGTILAD